MPPKQTRREQLLAAKVAALKAENSAIREVARGFKRDAARAANQLRATAARLDLVANTDVGPLAMHAKAQAKIAARAAQAAGAAPPPPPAARAGAAKAGPPPAAAKPPPAARAAAAAAAAAPPPAANAGPPPPAAAGAAAAAKAGQRPLVIAADYVPPCNRGPADRPYSPPIRHGGRPSSDSESSSESS